MYCPVCGSEYREGFIRCADCDAALVYELPRRQRSQIQLVQIFETGNPALIPVVESLLNESKIEFLAKNERMHDMLGGGPLAPTQFWVREEDREAAEAVLDDLADSEDDLGKQP